LTLKLIGGLRVHSGTMPARAKTPAKIPRQPKAARVKLKKSQQEAKKFEAELEEVIEQARGEGQKETAPAST
jgi:hypothetical protein